MLKKIPAYLSISRTDWEGFKISLQQRINLNVPLQTESQLNLELEFFFNDMQYSAKENILVIKIRPNGNNYPDAIKDLIQKKKWKLDENGSNQQEGC